MSVIAMRPGRALLVASLVLAGVGLGTPGWTAEWQWTPDLVADVVAVGSAELAPDGSSVVFTRSRWRAADAKPGPAYTDLWRVAFAGGEPQRLTATDATDASPRWSPDGSKIAFLSRRGSDSPKTRIWVLPSAGGEPYALSDEKVDVASFAWSPDGSRIAYVAVDPKSAEREKAEKAGRDEVVVDQDLRPRRLWILDVASGKAEKLAALGEESAWAFAWAPDGQALVASITEKNRTDDSYMFKRVLVLPLQGERREIAPIVGKVGEVAWSHDGKSIAWLGGVDASDPQAGSVFVAPAQGGAARNLTGDREETASAIAWRKDGRLAVAAVVGTRTKLELVDAASGARETLVAPGPVVFTSASWSADGTRYAFIGSMASHPPDVYAGSYAAPAPKKRARRMAPVAPARLSRSNPQLEGLPMGAQETIRYKAKDGLDVEAVLVKPVGFAEGTRYPLVVVVHGGPESEYLDGWLTYYSTPAQALAERGYAVLFPNYRGSTGRGVAYAKADHRDLGGKEFTDCIDGIDHLAAQGLVDTTRVGMTGGSYGGYFTALAVTKYAERFAAGVELFGIVNWESFLGQSDIPIENSLVHWALWCYDEPALCRDRSAVGHLDTASVPTLILHGAQDLRVPKPQSDELYQALVWKKVPVEYVVYPREGHGFRERPHRVDTTSRLLAWMDQYLK